MEVFAFALAFGVAQDAEKLKTVLKDGKVDPAWIYNDLAKATAEARQASKPLLVVFR